MTVGPIAVAPDEWTKVRAVWAVAEIDIPELPAPSDQAFLTELRRVVVNFQTAKAATEADRDRAWTFSEIADQCRDLSDALGQIDDIAFARIAGASPVPADQLLTSNISNLDLLESALRNASSPRIPRRKQHEHNDFLISLLADAYERTTDRSASVTNNPITNEREGQFISFVSAFIENFLPDYQPKPNGRAIQRALKSRRDHPDPLATT